MAVRASATVACAPHEAFAVVSDPAQDPVWRQDVVSVELLEGAACSVGASYRARVRVMGREIDVLFTIAELEPDDRVSFRLGAPIAATAGYVVEPDGEGCRVTFELDMGAAGGFAIARERVVGPAIRHGAERDLQVLARLLEDSGDVA